MKKISVVYVTYHPNKETLKRSIESISEQVDRVIVVDNTPQNIEEHCVGKNIKSIFLGENMGIAYAQNTGIREAMREGAEFVILSDQDSIYPQDYVRKMLEPFETGENIAAVAPLFRDTNQNRQSEGFIVKNYFFAKRVFPVGGRVEVLHAIASGKLIDARVLSSVGMMREELFIDWVDLEWCWRAQKEGYKIIGNADVKITHTLGDKAVNIGFRDVNLRSFVRHYYMTRNAFYLALHCESLSFLQKLFFLMRAFRYPIAFPLLAKPHLKNLKYSWLGMFDGLFGRLGKLDIKS